MNQLAQGRASWWLVAGAMLCCAASCSRPDDRPVVIGSKKFTESVILAEIGVRMVRQGGVAARREDLGGTPSLWLALVQGDVDAYPEYTGTISKQILKSETTDLAAALKPQGIRVSPPLGFRNNYGLGMRKDRAAALRITAVSDLAEHADLRFGFTHEFLDRADGWPGLRQHYGLPVSNADGMNHSLAYRALLEGAVDVIDVYTTDGEIDENDLVVLEDDRRFFPAYEAVWLYRADLASRHPAAVQQLLALEDRISEAEMRSMNSTVQQLQLNEGETARAFLKREFDFDEPLATRSLADRLLRSTGEHLLLVIPSLAAAVLIGVPLGVLAARRRMLGAAVLAASGVLQTIPSLALLLFMIPVMMWLVGRGTGAPPAIAALFLYSLLPIVRNTHAGLQSIPGPLHESAHALGLSPAGVLWLVELPLALPTILAGIRTAAVINVGTATLGGFIGAGGYGRPILRGIDKFDIALMLEGAIPAAVMALAIDALLGAIERKATVRQ